MQTRSPTLGMKMAIIASVCLFIALMQVAGITPGSSQSQADIQSEIERDPPSIASQDPRVTDVNGILRLSYVVGQELKVSVQTGNSSEGAGDAVLIIEIRDSKDVTVLLVTRPITEQSEDNPDVSWFPDESGKYHLRAFAISSLDKPIWISSVTSSEVQVDEIRLPEGVWNRNEAAVKIGIADKKVKELFGHKVILLLHVRASGVGFPGCEGNCGIMRFVEDSNTNESVDLGVDLIQGRVVSIKATPGFVSDEEQFKIFGEVEEEIFRATISFSNAVPKSAFDAVGSEFGIEVTYVSYEHLDGTAQAGSFSDPVDLDELENKLELEDDRLFGITFFLEPEKRMIGSD